MPNYRISIDLSDLYIELEPYCLREYSQPFSLYIMEAENPDDVASSIMRRIQGELLKKDKTIKTRILCRKVRRLMRIDRIECL